VIGNSKTYHGGTETRRKAIPEAGLPYNANKIDENRLKGKSLKQHCSEETGTHTRFTMHS